MASVWFYERDGKQQGPVSGASLKRLAEMGKLRPSDMIWREGSNKRIPALSVTGLFDRRPDAARGGPEEEADYEVVEGGKDRSPPPVRRPPPEDKPAPKLLAEALVTYRSGYPDLEGPVSGKLVVDSAGVRFLFQVDDEKDEVRLSYQVVDEVLEPVKGDFPEAMKRKALGSKLGGTAGRLASGLVGSWLGGVAGDAIADVGHEAGKMAEKGGELGRPPRNRIVLYARIKKQRCKVQFDADGADRDEMNQEAQRLYKKIHKALEKSTTPEPMAVEEEPVPMSEAVEFEVLEPISQAAPEEERPTLPAPATPLAGKPFRVMSGGQVRGPYSLQELRGLLSGLREGDLIGVETWLPAATLGALLAGGGAAAPPPAGAAPPPAKPSAGPPRTEDGLIPADAEYMLL